MSDFDITDTAEIAGQSYGYEGDGKELRDAVGPFMEKVHVDGTSVFGDDEMGAQLLKGYPSSADINALGATQDALGAGFEALGPQLRELAGLFDGVVTKGTRNVNSV
jgi:hypothetical protein